MENKLNVPELENYSRLLAKKMATEFFRDGKSEITGAEVLIFSNVEQINFFILKLVFFKWKEETAKNLSSPYFDYNHPEVTAAVNQLSNALSNHIKLNPYHFETILADAIEETIYLSLSPYNYFRAYYFSPEKIRVSIEELKEKAKYLKINKLFFTHFIEKLETYRIGSFQVSDIMGYFQEAYYSTNDTFDSHEPIIEKLSAIIPIDLSKIVIDLKRKDVVPPTPLEVYELKKAQSVKDELNTVNNSNAELTLPHAPLQSIKLNLNQRIMFLKHLFNNDIEQMNHTMARIETSSSLDNAHYILGFNNWDRNNEVVQEFYELIENRFKAK
ncbi:MAG: hypothetical protein SFY32_17175 [Bacteroidota bacterium]|nr:hypothetical protein [Bacteroidota bacterium]